MSRASRLLRQALVPSVAFGAGFSCRFEFRDMTVSQYAAYASVTSWSHATHVFRHVGKGMSFGQGVFRNVEARELCVTAWLLHAAMERGMDTSQLRRAALRQVCEMLEEQPRGLAVVGLLGEDNGSLAHAIAYLSSLVAALEEEKALENQTMVSEVAAALNSVVKTGGDAWHEELGAEGVLHMARTVAIGSTWAGIYSTLHQVVPSRFAFSAEQGAAAEEAFDEVWAALRQPGAQQMVQQSEAPETQALRADLEVQLTELDKYKQGPRFTWIAADPCVVDATPTHQPTLETVIGKSEKPGVSVRSVVEGIAWVALVGVVVVSISDDGFSFLRFHSLPTELRASWRDVLRQNALRIEHLIAKYDGPDS